MSKIEADKKPDYGMKLWVKTTFFCLFLLLGVVLYTFTDEMVFMKIGPPILFFSPMGMAIVMLLASWDYVKSATEKRTGWKSGVITGLVAFFISLQIGIGYFHEPENFNIWADLRIVFLLLLGMLCVGQCIATISFWLTLRHSAYRYAFWFHTFIATVYWVVLFRMILTYCD